MATMHMQSSREDYLAQRVDELRADLRRRDPALLAKNTGAAYDGSRFNLSVWGQNIMIDTEDFIGRDPSGEAVDGMTQALLAYYFHTADGAPISTQWIAFSGLADGQFYAAAFQGYTGNELAKVFDNDLDLFQSSAIKLRGQSYALGDAAYIFQVLPLVSIMVVGWQGDEDFAPSYRLLFDKNINHLLPTDACAILGSALTRLLIKIRQRLTDKLDQSNGAKDNE
ncbi:MAG: DUF3786 domain-containing protein [Candidatus Promineifilaceae bacterium]|nr:DUF3786 domain-containing protein [Candidatus Promineifilaceae bacterium]